jgi:hypothetical protein
VRTFLGLALLALICGSSGCQASPRHVGERFAEAVERPGDADFDSLLAADAELFLPGPNRISTAAFREYLASTQRGHIYYHRASQVYDTPGGAGWMLEILRDQTVPVSAAEQAPLWMEVAVKDGKVSRGWMHFTVETLATLRQPPETYAQRAAAANVPLPTNWTDGTRAMLAAADARQQSADSASPWPAASSLVVASLGLAVATVLVFRRRHAPSVDPRGARLLELSSRRQLARKRTMPT